MLDRLIATESEPRMRAKYCFTAGQICQEELGSPLRDAGDPLIDVPVKRLVRMELAEGGSRTRGEVLRSVPGEWLAPFLPQRYDDPQEGIDVPLSSEDR